MKVLLLLCLTLNLCAQDFVPFFWDNSSATGNELLNNLLAFWKCDEASGNMTDSSGNSHTLTANGSPGTGTGIVSGARTYDESNPDYFTEAFNSLFGFGGGAFSITCWPQFDTTVTSDMSLIARGDFGGGVNFSWALLFDNGTPNDAVNFFWSTDGTFNAGNVVSFDLGGSVNSSIFYFICLRWDGATFHLSATPQSSGSLATDATASFSGTLSNSGNPTLSVGRLEGSGIHNMRGQIDEMGVWSGYLSDCEVGWLFTAKAGSFTYSSFDPFLCVP